jgi:hypothetical protein
MEAEFAAGLRSSALTRQIEEEMRARIARLMVEARADLRHEVAPCPRPLLDSAPRLAAELGCGILAIPGPRSRSLHRWLIRSRARRLGVQLVTLDDRVP